MPKEPIRVLVLPGLGGADGSTVGIRTALAGQGMVVHRWKLGTNHPEPELHDALRRRFFELAERAERPIALVGWSLGGLYAYRLAQLAPNHVRSVVTLGSPLAMAGHDPSLAVPLTSIYSKNDRVVSWQSSVVDDRVARHENVEVRSLHLTLGFDPAVLFAIGERVRRDPDRWKPFRAPLLMQPAFPRPGGAQH